MQLSAYFKKYSKAAIAFSGGVDSAFLLHEAMAYGAEVRAYYVKSAFQPQFELRDALRLAEELKAELTVVNVDVLATAEIAANAKERCYYCKKRLFTEIAKEAGKDGFSLIFDGTNASDDAADRPGMQALKELAVRSPLRECGLTKSMIRSLSKEAGLFTWDKPAYACLATRIGTGEEITAAKLARTEAAEDALFALGFRDFRLRSVGDTAKLQVPAGQLEQVLAQRRTIMAQLKPYYDTISLDLETRNESFD